MNLNKYFNNPVISKKHYFKLIILTILVIISGFLEMMGIGSIVLFAGSLINTSQKVLLINKNTDMLSFSKKSVVSHSLASLQFRGYRSFCPSTRTVGTTKVIANSNRRRPSCADCGEGNSHRCKRARNRGHAQHNCSTGKETAKR